MYCVYMHVTPSDKVYIGLTGNAPEVRWANGHGYPYNKYFTNAIRKYGWKEIKHFIIADNLTREEACELEIKLIEEYDATNPKKGYNIALGGQSSMLGRHHSEETKKKMSIKASEREYSQEYRDKISKQKKEQYQTNPEIRIKIKLALEKARKADHSWTEERRQKFSKARLGHTVSEDTRAKMREAHLGKTYTDETKKKIADSKQKQIVCLETGSVYESIKNAAAYLDVEHSWLGEICRKKKGTVNGLHFCFKVDLPINSPEARTELIAQIERNRKKRCKRTVLCIETGIIFESVTQASLSVGVSRKRIEKVCKTKGTAAGYHWKYCDE